MVNMSSIQALATQAGVAADAATRQLSSLTRVMALDHGKQHAAPPRAAPGLSRRRWRTPTRATGTRRTRRQSSPNGAPNCVHRIGRPIEVAHLAAFLISEEFELHHRLLPSGRRRPDGWF